MIIVRFYLVVLRVTLTFNGIDNHLETGGLFDCRDELLGAG